MTDKLFSIGGFDVLLWYVIALAAVILVVVLIVVIAVVCRKKSAKKNATEATIDSATDSATSTEENTQNDASVVEDEQTQPTQETKEQPVVSTETAATTEKTTTEDKPRPKNYHISLREDGKWQVKLGKGERALKLFDTQKEAIAFAKEKAKNQEGSITIHKVDGKIRKQKY